MATDTIQKVRIRWNHQRARSLVMKMLRWELKRGSTLADVGHGCPADDIANDAWLSWRIERRRRAIAKQEGKPIPNRHHPKAHCIWAFGKYFRDEKRQRRLSQLRAHQLHARNWYLHPAPRLESEMAERLNPKQRLLLKLLRHGYTKTECADLLGVSPSRVTQMVVTIRVRAELDWPIAKPSIAPIVDKLLTRLLVACQCKLVPTDKAWVWWNLEQSVTWTDAMIADRRKHESERVEQPTWYMGE